MTTINPSQDPRINISQTTNGSDLTTEQTTAASSEFQPLDALDSGHVVVQQFLSISRWGKKEYQADLRHPTLLPPDINEGGPTPLDLPWQKAINRQFQDLIKRHLLKKIKEGGKKTSENLQENLKTTLQEKSNLNNKEAKSNQEQESPTLSEPQIEKRVNTILHAVVSGKVTSLNEDDQKNVKEATEAIQNKFHLPTWKFGTLEPKDLTPTKEIEPPIEVTTARTEILMENIDNLANSIQIAADKMLIETPKSDPKSLAVGDLVKMIALAISELKQVLQDMQISESKINSKMAIVKKEQKDDHLADVYKAIAKRKSIERKIRKQKKTARIMKIVAPVVSGLVALAAVAFAVLSLGTAAAPLAIAVAIVSTIMFAYTVVDSEEGYTQQMIEAFNSSMDDIKPQYAKELTKASILAVAAIILVLAIMASGGAAAGSFAVQVAKEVAVQVVLQASMMFIMSSNILPDLVVDSCVAAGAVSKDDQETIMIIQMIVMALTLILCMEAMAKGQGLLGSGLSMAKSGAQSAINNTKTMLQSVSQTTMESAKNAAQKSLEELNKAIRAMLENLIASAKESMSNAAKSIGNITYESTKQAAWEKLTTLASGLKDTFGRPDSLAKIAHNCEDGFKIAGLGVNAGYSIYLGTISLQLAGLFRELGDIEKEKEALQALIQLFEKLLTSMQQDQTGRAEWINNLTKAMDNMYASESIMSSKITQQYTA